MRLFFSLLFVLSGILFTFSCNSPSEEGSDQKDTIDSKDEVRLSKPSSQELKIIEKNGLKLIALPEATAFPEAELSLVTPISSLKAGKQLLQFELDEFDLGDQTDDERASQLANSDKGQLIHYIHNNGPYQAENEDEFEVELTEGHNVILAFLSKSYHESVKEGNAFVFEDILIGESYVPFDVSEPHLFYSRPKGNYSLRDSDKILIDFFLLNAELSSSGIKVELTIDETEFLLDSWQAYWVEGLGVGEHTFRIRLLNTEGELVYGPFNDSGVRTITIEE